MGKIDGLYNTGENVRFEAIAIASDTTGITGLTGTISVWNDSETLVVNAQAITPDANRAGWYYYIYNTCPASLYSFIVTFSNGLVANGKLQVGDATGALEVTVASRASQTSVDTIDGIVDAILIDTDDLQTTKGERITATGFSTHSASDVWAVTTRTLSSFGSLVADIATAVWGAATRTLSAFGFAVETDTASRNASKADVSGLATAAELALIDGKIDVSLVDTSNLMSMATPDGDGYILTVSALQNAPFSDVSGLALEATSQTILIDTNELQTNQGDWATADLTTVLANIATVDGVVDSIKTQTDILVGGAGPLRVDVQFYLDGTVTAVSDVITSVWYAGEMKASGISDIDGQISLLLDNGGPYEIRARKAGYAIPITDIADLQADAELVIYAGESTLISPTLPGECVIYENLFGYNSDNSPASHVGTAKIIHTPFDYGGALYEGAEITGTWDAENDRIYWQFPYGCIVRVDIRSHGMKNYRITIPESDSARISEVTPL